jgi:hypothetical protein
VSCLRWPSQSMREALDGRVARLTDSQSRHTAPGRLYDQVGQTKSNAVSMTGRCTVT